jgi:hypothetical protein
MNEAKGGIPALDGADTRVNGGAVKPFINNRIDRNNVSTLTKTAWLGLLASAILGTFSCEGSLKSQPIPAKWTTGFWFWHASPLETAQVSAPLEVLYVHVGDIRRAEYKGDRPWSVYAALPSDLPPAHEYWLVYRYVRQGVPDPEVASMVASDAARLTEAARQRHLKITGVQLDVDSPTSALPRYAALLHEIKKELPRGLEISVTALLDWFREGTAVAEVIKEADEFVPQFYDLSENEYSPSPSIAAKIDATRWSPVFSRFQKRYRAGISIFGRAKLFRREADPRSSYGLLGFLFNDVTPLDIANRAGFNPEVSHSDAGETILTYRASRKLRIDYEEFQPGDAMQFILPSEETVRSAVSSAKRLRGCSGVVFFRWPGANESLVMRPDQVLRVAGVALQPIKPEVFMSDGGCAAVHCVDLYLLNAARLSRNPCAIASTVRRNWSIFCLRNEFRFGCRTRRRSNCPCPLIVGAPACILGARSRRAVPLSPLTSNHEDHPQACRHAPVRDLPRFGVPV